MPLIVVNTSLTLEKKQKDKIAGGLRKAIALIPGKGEAVSSVDISDGRAMYQGEEERELAYVHLRMMNSSAFEHKEKFVLEAYKVLRETTGLTDDQVCVFISELKTWGSHGRLNKLKNGWNGDQDE
jgi:phenylpyruvate tautomerase PptA (4-oxalocrotonate tautomerase family)